VDVVLLVNEASGSGTDAAGLEAALRAEGADVRRIPLDRSADAIAAGPERVVVAGGDGSIASAAEAAGRLGVPLAVVATGTANDFARRMELPGEPGDACRLAVRGTRVRRLDLARLDGRPFVNVASAGLASAAAQRARPLKRVLGPLAYMAGAVRTAATERPLRCGVRCDGREVFAGFAWQLMVGCSGAFGAGSRLAEADPSDGLLDVVAIAAGPRLRLARHAYGLRRGRVSDQPGGVHGRGRVVELDLPSGERLNLDGELVPAGARATVEPGRFELVVA
jgi:diacylglycerol kinase family enzyme